MAAGLRRRGMQLPEGYIGGVLVLLPPSEAKTEPTPGSPPLDLGRLSFPQLGAIRSELVAALIDLTASHGA